MLDMHIFLVGGAVRDRLMGHPPGDRDWVVIGSTPEQMGAAGYLPVGRDFPVFLHPRTREEYALARIERKTAPGYHGFSFRADPDVTLEEDLSRRDLTINAMAMDDDGTVIDPWGGQADLRDRVLRHVGPAFVEDPVRILRLARFLARFPAFSVAPETLALCRTMVAAGEVDALVPERVWQELSRGLMEAAPSRMFLFLRDCGALARLLPEVEALFGVPQRAEYHPEIDTGVHLMLVLDMAARLDTALPVRFACLTHDLGKATTPADVLPRHIGHEARSVRLLGPLAQRLRVPVECKELAEVVAREHGNVHRSGDLSPEATLRLLARCDAIRKPSRFAEVLLACECDARGRLGLSEQPYDPARRLADALRTVLAVDTAQVSAQALAAGLSGPAVGEAIAAARLTALQKAD
jgi:tRNA nucleotidyltransferase (CCA-adding enzyme)